MTVENAQVKILSNIQNPAGIITLFDSENFSNVDVELVKIEPVNYSDSKMRQDIIYFWSRIDILFKKLELFVIICEKF